MADQESTEAEKIRLEIPGLELLEPIGEGGTAKVYRARQLSLNRTVAVKLLPIGRGKHLATAFQRESRLMASLVHPNLVTVFDCGQAKDHYYIVTELIEGSTLRPMMTPGQPWPIARASAMIDRVARALGYIHGQGVLHLDFKPENILCDVAGTPKITDFGLALTEVNGQALAELRSAQGTPDYCAPEQRFGLPTCERTDLFSLSVLAYELLTGQVPGRVYRSARQLNPVLPETVDKILRRGLARSPEDRFATVEDFRRELIGALMGQVGPARRRLAMCSALAVILLLVAFLATYERRPHDANPPENATPIQAWIIHDRSEQLGLFDAQHTELAGVELQSLFVRGNMPTGAGAPPLPIWPSTRPVLVISSAKAVGFVHPLFDRTLGRRVLSDWRQLLEAPPTPAQDNFCEAGDFAGDCLTYDPNDESRPWRAFNRSIQKDGDGDLLAIAEPTDRPGNPALMLHRKDPNTRGQEFGCYQWLSRIPEREGTIVVMRYRARAEDGDGRLTVRVHLPLLLPVGARDEKAERLRRLSVPFDEFEHGPDKELRLYRLDDWIAPAREWQTYYAIWEWPPYCQDARTRNVLVFYTGTGKVWLDDLEIFTWELGGAP